MIACAFCVVLLHHLSDTGHMETKNCTETTAKHTPGPWNVEASGYQPYVGVHAEHEPDGLIALLPEMDSQCDGGSDEETRLANARLISAAPELLEALRKLHHFAENMADSLPADRAVAEALAGARVAIARAGGCANRPSARNPAYDGAAGVFADYSAP